MLISATGLVLAFISLVLGATIVAGGGITEWPGGVIALALLILTPLGLYLLAAGLWGGWSPGADTRLRVRSVRVALVWVLLVGGYMFWGVPLTSAARMTRAEWINFGILVSLLTIATVALIGISRRPKVAVTLLSAGASYGAFMAFRLSAVLLTHSATPYSGPARSLSLVIAGSFGLALVAAFILAWPLRSSSTPRAT